MTTFIFMLETGGAAAAVATCGPAVLAAVAGQAHASVLWKVGKVHKIASACKPIRDTYCCPLLLLMQGARVPVLVGGMLASHYADTLACGISHIAVVATQRGKANGGVSGGLGGGGGSSSSAAVTRLLTWGQNSRGQLGLGAAREDHLLPQVEC
jgi:hypothetical protein